MRADASSHAEEGQLQDHRPQLPMLLIATVQEECWMVLIPLECKDGTCVEQAELICITSLGR